jgi:hypothetical protein
VVNTCLPVSEKNVLDLFNKWNFALQSGDPHQVAALYTAHVGEQTVFLPSSSDNPFVTEEQLVGAYMCSMQLGAKCLGLLVAWTYD